MTLRVLFLGDNWFGSAARACSQALRRQGCDVADIDVQTVFPQLRRLSSRAVMRLFGRRLVREYNDYILDTVAAFRPDILLAWKGQRVEAQTLRIIGDGGITLYNYYPDTSAFTHGPLLPASLAEYDCVFTPKRFLEKDVSHVVKLKNVKFVPFGYDPEIHYPQSLDERDIAQYGCDVGFIATYTSHKEKILEDLIVASPHLDLQIWGNQWGERCQSSKLKNYIKNSPVNGSSYTRALNAFRINLAIMSGIVPGASRGDETSARTFEIPACGGFMLHERSGELLEMFEEGEEMAGFDSTKELAEKIDYYLSNPEEREAIARAGYLRCVPDYSYDSRMAEILKWHENNGNGQKVSGELEAQVCK